MSESRPPDDTPTRLQRYQVGYAGYHANTLISIHPSDVGDWCKWADVEAEVSRLREELERSKVPGLIRNLLDDNEKTLADVSRLQQENALMREAMSIQAAGGDELHAERRKLLEENALLRRSLEMLTKQLDEKDERITELTFTIIRHNSPA